MREGSLEAPTRHPLDWKSPEFQNEGVCSKNWNGFTMSAMAADVVFRCVPLFRLCLTW